MNDSDDKLAVLWEERAIEKVMLRFGRSLDLGDWPGYRSCFTERVHIDFKRLTGFDEIKVSADLWTRFAELIQSPVRRHHAYSNFQAEIDGDTARATTYFAARVWSATDRGGPTYTEYGWYQAVFIRAADQWLISRIKHDYLWVEGNMGIFTMDDPQLVAVMRELFSEDNVAAARADPIIKRQVKSQSGGGTRGV